ncbi:MAG TPA: DUF1376 domain-containing protein [Geminicoccus sp.]|jgi:uncharacterized protein YdaU (DUF1376 family)|uniref:DUF1376 domain-containing protein n=1 Tax=Geminicoccus sp. TaxID=2024832 RepID=UPI002E36B275|nr:DUF1376 domain-containing protein [Geminicoccus sp.]HEX2526904.1 DUF1376 domain-containing protein [Geminicoccus sp.]
MADFPAMPFYTDAYLADTTHLTTEEHGAYLLLLFAAWRSPGCSLRDDDAFLARVAKVSLDRWLKRIKPVMLPFWQVKGGIWTQKKQQSVREKLGAISKKRAEAGRQGRVPKPLAEQEAAPANEGANGQQPAPYPKPKTKTKQTPPLVPLLAEDGVGNLDAEFETWWQTYPRQVGRQAAAEAYRQARQEATAEQLAEALAAAAARWRTDGIQERYIPHPANWLEQRRWEDQTAVIKQAEPAGPDPVRIQRVSVGATMAQASTRLATLERIFGQHTIAEIAQQLGREGDEMDPRSLFVTVERLCLSRTINVGVAAVERSGTRGCSP